MMIFRLTKVEVLAIFAKSDDFLRSGLDRRSFYSYLRRLRMERHPRFRRGQLAYRL